MAIARNGSSYKRRKKKDPDSSDPQIPFLADTLTKEGVTLHMDAEYETGTYLNGDYWIKIPAAGSIDCYFTPLSADVSVIRGGRAAVLTNVHGLVKDPVPDVDDNVQGWDELFFSAKSGPGFDPVAAQYDAALNIGIGVTSAAMLTISAAQSLVKAVSDLQPADGTSSLLDAQVFTFVDTIPNIGDFRPPWSGTGTKISTFNASDIDFSALPQIPYTSYPIYLGGGDPGVYGPALTKSESLANMNFQVNRYLARGTAIQNMFVPQKVQYAYPRSVMPTMSYHGWNGQTSGIWGMLLQEITQAEANLALIHVIQAGIDLKGIFDQTEGPDIWRGAGGHGHNRSVWIIAAGKLLGDTAMQDVYLDNPTKQHGAEFMQSFTVTETSTGVLNNGNGAYVFPRDKDMPEWGMTHGHDPTDDNLCMIAPSPGKNYRQCCAPKGWYMSYMVLASMGLESKAPAAFFDYCERHFILGEPTWSDSQDCYNCGVISGSNYWGTMMGSELFQQYGGQFRAPIDEKPIWNPAWVDRTNYCE